MSREPDPIEPPFANTNLSPLEATTAGGVKVRTVMFYVQDQFVGEAKARRFSSPAGMVWPHSTTYICPQCGKGWLRRHVALERYLPGKRLCPDHGSGIIMPSNLSGEFFDFSYDLLRYEILAVAKLGEDMLSYSTRLCWEN